MVHKIVSAMSAEPGYMSGPHDGPKCACRHDGMYWLKRCAAAAANDRTESQRWAREHILRSPETTFTAAHLTDANVIIQTGDYIHTNEDLR